MSEKTDEILVGKKVETFEKTDARGRVLKVQKPGILAQYRLIAMLGQAADSETYLNMCMPLIYLVSLDGDDTIGFNTKREMEGIISRLDNDGFACLMALMQEHFDGANANTQEGKDAIKK